MFSHRPLTRVFLLAMVIAIGWTAFTHHVWEDYYITFRASKNLATGHGLTFTEGERVHSFTSPLGVLLPAAASFITGNASDGAALGVFRFLAILALAGAVSLVVALARRGDGAGSMAAGLTAALLLTDAKILDFTINGMETPFLLLFMAWTLWALAADPPRAWVHLGLAWAGLMWTRPDAFVYIGGLAGAALIFRPATGGWPQRIATVRGYLQATLLTTALYLPWLVWAWRYYGTPVPHTITAKGLFGPVATLGQLWERLVGLPGMMWSDPSIFAGTFMPGYSYNPGAPLLISKVSAVVALVAALLWAVPRLRWEARVASLAALAGQVYIHVFVGYATPWYLPAVAFLSLIAIGFALAQVVGNSRQPAFRIGARIVGGGLVTAAAVLALAVAWQLRWQQRIVENGLRQPIGEWLKAESASPRDTVFLEPLGYIGYFSGLKMLDYPGLSSPEVVAVRRAADAHDAPSGWAELILALQPDWLVLRENERVHMEARDSELFPRYYELAKVFNARDQVDAVRFLPWRGYVYNDAYFEVYRRKAGLRDGLGLKRINMAAMTVSESSELAPHDTGFNILAHASSRLEFPITPGAQWLSGSFGIFEGAYANPAEGTDGAGFTVNHISESGTRTVLLDRSLDPMNVPADRGTHPFRFELPPEPNGRIELVTSDGPQESKAFDWTYWSELMLETPHDW